MKRVLLLCEYPALNGAERSLLAVLPVLRAAGFELLVAAPPRGPLAEALAGEDVTHVDLAFTEGASLGLRRDELLQVLRRHRPRLVHGNSLSMARLSGPVTRGLQVPSIGHMRDIVGLSAAAVRDINLHQRLLAVSQATRDWHAGQGVDEQRLFVLYNGVDLHRFRPRPASGSLQRELDLPREALLIGCIGQIGMRKGQDVLLNALHPLVERWPGVHLIVVGVRHSLKDEAIAFEQSLRDSAGRSPLTGHIHFIGQRDDVHRLLNELTLLIHPARQEPLGRVLLEALAAGVPIIATDVGGTREIVAAGAAAPAGRLVPAEDAMALRIAIEELLQDVPLRESLAARGRERAERLFASQRSGEALVAHYEAVLSEKAT